MDDGTQIASQAEYYTSIRFVQIAAFGRVWRVLKESF
jgi:hypothetical protein